MKGQPAGVNLRELAWDNERAELTQRWAEQCMPGHDHIRNLGTYFGYYILTLIFQNYSEMYIVLKN